MADAGNGIVSDVANWAAARLTRDPSARQRRARAGVDVAQFARVVASDPQRIEGTKASRMEEFPAEDTEKYCQGEIALFIFDRVIDTLNLSREVIGLWTTSIIVYRAAQDSGAKPTMDEILSSEADWLKVAMDVIDVLNFAMVFTESAGVEIPAVLDYAWEIIYSITGNPPVDDPELDWGDLEDSVCKEYLP